MRALPCLLMLGFALTVIAPAASSGAKSLDVSLTLEDSTFLAGQSVYAIVRVRNTGKRRVDGVAPITPGTGYLRVALHNRITGNEVPHLKWYVCGAVSGSTLAPGAVVCFVFDITRDIICAPSEGTLSDRLEFSALPVGDYMVRWDYMPKVEKGRESDRIRGREIPFTVLPLSTAPEEQALVSEFLSALPSVGWLDDSARAWLPRFYGSKYLLRIYMRTARRLNELDFDEIWDGVKRAGAPAERCAALLAFRLLLTDTTGHFTPEWKERIAPTLTSQIERDVLTIVPRRPATTNRATSGQ